MRVPIVALAALGLVLALGASAGLENVSYPVVELGDCQDQDSCRDYCSQPSNFDACMTFAEANNLLEEEEIQEYRQVQEIVAQGGPGGCVSGQECEAYCSDLNNMRECLAFAEEHGMMDKRELEDARKVQSALDAGYSMPGGCVSEQTCKTYCEEPGNMEECLTFAQVAGFMSEEEIQEARSVMTIMQSGNSPGACQSREECEAYCEDEANREECTAFAVEAGFMTQEEADAGRQMGGQESEELMGPGGCDDKESCRAYCEQEANREECGAFFGEELGDDRGPMEGEEAFEEFDYGDRESFLGPGGCVSEEECFAFCSDPANKEVCTAPFEDVQEGATLDIDELKFEFDEGERDESQERDEEARYPEQGDYQIENGDIYDQYDDRGTDSYESGDDEFESFDPGDDFSGFDQRGEDEPYGEIYVDPGFDGEMPSGTEASQGEFAAPLESGSSEPQSAADSDATFVESFKHFVDNVLTKTRQFMAI